MITNAYQVNHPFHMLKKHNQKILRQEEKENFTMATTKITKRVVLTAIMNGVSEEGIGGVSQADVKAYCAKEIENLDKRAASSGISKKEQEAREAEEAVLYNALTEEAHPVAWYTRNVPEFNDTDTTPQKVTSIFKRLMEQGKVTKLVVKGVTYYKRVEA